jgi:4-diphosphocytidyl-2-C-methyl-D-erythritol kinase
LLLDCLKSSPMHVIHEFAPAKINLYLHVTGRQDKGLHDLDSLVAFASVGDTVEAWPADAFSFVVQGPQAAALAGQDDMGNLVVLAARSLGQLTGRDLNVALRLTKNLPVASGVGGGSSDAAAALRALARLWGLDTADPRLAEAAARHGQDVPVCMHANNIYMTAHGRMTAPSLPRVAVILVNPNKGLPTPAVFKEFRAGGDSFSPLSRLTEQPTDIYALVAALRRRGNDLYAPACRLMPEVAQVIAALDATDKCLLARMSGSGATCFALYREDAAAATAAAKLRSEHPGWWVEAGCLNPGA